MIIHGPSEDIEDNNFEDSLSDSDIDDDDFPTVGNQQHWQHSY